MNKNRFQVSSHLKSEIFLNLKSENFPNMEAFENTEFSPLEVQALAELDLRGVICPYNFVKTKLKLEGMDHGDVLTVILDDGEPMRNVPQSIRNEGHVVLRQEPFEGAFRIFIRKQED